VRDSRNLAPLILTLNEKRENIVNEILSSGLTFFYKYIFTSIWSIGFGFGTVEMIHSNSPEALQFAMLWVVGMIFLWLLAGRLKRVEMTECDLIISNYFCSFRVSISDIEEVRQNRFINTRPITIKFRHNTIFGSSIIFMPKTSFRLFSEDPVVDRLREAAKKCGGSVPE
jgi:hypothetical protein